MRYNLWGINFHLLHPLVISDNDYCWNTMDIVANKLEKLELPHQYLHKWIDSKVMNNSRRADEISFLNAYESWCDL